MFAVSRLGGHVADQTHRPSEGLTSNGGVTFALQTSNSVIGVSFGSGIGRCVRSSLSVADGARLTAIVNRGSKRRFITVFFFEMWDVF